MRQDDDDDDDQDDEDAGTESDSGSRAPAVDPARTSAGMIYALGGSQSSLIRACVKFLSGVEEGETRNQKSHGFRVIGFRDIPEL